MTKIKCISVRESAEKIFGELNKIRPNDLSFSSMVALACKEFIERNNKNNLKIEDFGSGLPDILAEIETWKSLIEEMPVSDFKKLQRRHTQLGNIINKRVLKCL